jgi:hypothetical protein
MMILLLRTADCEAALLQRDDPQGGFVAGGGDRAIS